MPTPEKQKTRTKPAPDILRDARRVRDILSFHSIEHREILLKMALASLDAANAWPARVSP